jgi:hypothetical protein
MNLGRIVDGIVISLAVGFPCYMCGGVLLLLQTGTGPGAENIVSWAGPLILVVSGIVGIVCAVAVDRSKQRKNSN